MKKLLTILISAIMICAYPAMAEDMEPATVYSGPEDGATYNEAQTELILLWEGHSLNPSTLHYSHPVFFVTNTDTGKEAQCDECTLMSLEGGGINAVKFSFADAGITQTRANYSDPYKMVVGNFMITIPEGIYESASAAYNCEQTIRFRQVDSTTLIEELSGNYDGAVLEVYTLSGSHVMTAADPDALKKLPSGFYVINGRKYLLRGTR